MCPTNNDNRPQTTFHGDYSDIGEDKNFFIPKEKKASETARSSSLFMDDMAKNIDVALADARNKLNPYWVNSDPQLAGFVNEEGEAYLFFLSEELKGKIILIDFWDFTLPHSLRGILYIKEWLKRYGGANFTVIGVHASPFPFGNHQNLIRTACLKFGVHYPVCIDHDFALWRAFENRYWPRRVLFNSKQQIIADRVGSDGYQATERDIQSALREIAPGLPCPPLLTPFKPSEADDYEMPGHTPDVFFGLKKQRLGNTEKLTEGVEIIFTTPEKQESNIPYLQGPWSCTEQSIYLAAGPYQKGQYQGESSFTIKFTGTHAYMVAASRLFYKGEITAYLKIQILIDGKPIKDDFRGSDLKVEEGKKCNGYIFEPKLFELFKNAPHKEYELKIVLDHFAADVFELFALYFTSY